MCRLLGYAADRAASLRDLVGDNGLDAFTALSAQHRDGWGMAWRGSDGTLAAEKSLGAARYSDRWHALAAAPLSDLGLAHLRWATPGLDVTDLNTHPFLADDMAFAHNGRLLPVADVDALLPDACRGEVVGTTDSERFFALVRSRVGGAGGVLDAFRSASRAVLDQATCSSLNSVLLTDSALYAVSCFDERLRPIPDEPEHFVLRWRRFAHAVVVASSGWGHDDWEAVPNGHVLVVDRATRGVEILPFATPPGSPERLARAGAEHRCT